MPAPRVVLFGLIDLYDEGLVENISSIREQRGFHSGKLWDNTYTLDVDNSGDFFSADNPNSYFRAYRWIFATLEIWDSDGQKIWDGIVTDVKRDHNTKRAKIISSSVMQKYSTMPIAYTSSAYETPAAALRNIFTAYDFTAFDNASLSQSENVLAALTTVPVNVKVNFIISDNITMQQAVEKLAEVACAESFIMGGILHFRVWEPWAQRVTRGEAVITVDESQILDFGSIEYALPEIINDYQIGYYSSGSNNAFETDTTGLGRNIGAASRSRYGTRALPNFDTGSSTGDDKAIIFENDLSAYAIGQQYILRTHKKAESDPVPLQIWRFVLDYEFPSVLTIMTYFRATFTPEAWDGKLFEVIETSRNEATGIIQVTALEVQE